MGAVTTKSLADLRRRRLQTAILAMVLFLASASATLALSIFDGLQAPFDRAFATANGAHLVIDYDASVSDQQLVATSAAGPVTASAGPWPVAIAALAARFGVIGRQQVSGRPEPSASIDNVTVSQGRWWRGPGEIVLDQDTAANFGIDLGQTVRLLPSTPGSSKPGSIGKEPAGGGPPLLPPGGPTPPDTGSAITLTVVGIAASVSTPDVVAWISPAEVAALTPGGSPAREMFYRVEPATSAANLAAATAAITRNLPAGALARTVTYLETKASVEDIAQLYVPILLAFAVFALLAAAFSIVNVVSGVVLTSYREIGVMKAVGFTPAQVTSILLVQILLPAGVGCGAGVIVGSIASQPTIERTTQSFGLPGSFTLSAPVILGVLAIAATTVILAALGPALRAGRLSAVSAITRAGVPSAGANGGRMRRLGLRLPVRLPIRLGIAAGLSHPIRAAMTLGALLVGVAAVTFALGMNLSLVRVMTQLHRDVASPVRVEFGGPASDAASNSGDIGTAIRADPATARVVSIAQADVGVPGIGRIPFVGYDGDSSWIGYDTIRGRWFRGPGEVVAPTNFFTETGMKVGDTVQLAGADQVVTVRLVGEIFDMPDESRDGLVLRGAWTDLLAIEPSAQPVRWEVQPIAGTQPDELRASLQSAIGGQVDVYTLDDSSSDIEFLLFLSVITFMGVVLVAISLGGVFDTVLLETRQRTREMAVLKALGLSPRAVIAMVIATVVPAGLVAGLLGVPIGLGFQRAVLSYMGQTAAKTGIPDRSFDVFAPPVLIGLAMAGLVI
ncbi:MAG TPA: FtsX-like permease family protein, partial [Candidatus Limnocylindrales bacterium]|nr:FtsX-like permease family protein [Candidatus Limnocylindrales bacterium]